GGRGPRLRRGVELGVPPVERSHGGDGGVRREAPAALRGRVTMQDLFSITGKVALVTGGSRGIGLMIARGYVEAGAKVYVSSRKASACDEVATELSRAGTCI